MADERTDPQYKLRFSEELRDRIAGAAKANNRSMNAEIIARLEQSFESENGMVGIALDQAAVLKYLAATERVIEEISGIGGKRKVRISIIDADVPDPRSKD